MPRKLIVLSHKVTKKLIDISKTALCFFASDRAASAISAGLEHCAHVGHEEILKRNSASAYYNSPVGIA